MSHKLEEEVNYHMDLSFQLERPSELHIYRVLSCECGNDSQLEIALTDNNEWHLECLACNDTAAPFSEIMEKLR